MGHWERRRSRIGADRLGHPYAGPSRVLVRAFQPALKLSLDPGGYNGVGSRRKQFEGVLEHNWLDVVSMALLAPELVDCEDDPISYGANPRVVLGPDKSNPSPEGIAYLCAYRSTLDAASKHELAGQARRQGNWMLAAELWEELARLGDTLAIERLAKYFEHQVKDLGAASNLTAKLLELAPGDPAHLHREARLKRKLKIVIITRR